MKTTYSKKLAFDIGANIGRWTNANINNYDTIITIEASPYTFEELKNYTINNSNNILNYAVCNNDEKDIVFYHADADTLSTINKQWLTDIKSRFYNYSHYKEITCKTITIDKLISIYGEPDLIKIDVEGGEYECILSLTKKVKQLCFEWASETNDITFNCLDYLLTLGFNKFAIQKEDNYTFIPNDTEYYDVLYIKNILSKTIPKKDWGMIWCM
jgi:FkbM family methyltransferase